MDVISGLFGGSYEPILPLSRTWVEISLDALRHNFAYAQKLTGKKVLCVVKADAYGHGAVRCCQCLEAAGADAFGVSCLSEALELRQAGIQVPLLILGYTAPEYAAILGAQHITQALQGEESARALSQAALQAGVTIEAHIKVDTGMGRLGIFAQTREACQAGRGGNRPDLCPAGPADHRHIHPFFRSGRPGRGRLYPLAGGELQCHPFRPKIYGPGGPRPAMPATVRASFASQRPIWIWCGKGSCSMAFTRTASPIRKGPWNPL